MFQQIASVLENLSPYPPPLPDAFGVGMTFDWGNRLSVSSGRSTRADGALAHTQRTQIGQPCVTAPQSSPRTLRALFSSGQKQYSPSKERRFHPYAKISKPIDTENCQHLDIFHHDWAADASPTPSVGRVYVPPTTPSTSIPDTSLSYQTPNPPFASQICHSNPSPSPVAFGPSTIFHRPLTISHPRTPLPESYTPSVLATANNAILPAARFAHHSTDQITRASMSSVSALPSTPSTPSPILFSSSKYTSSAPSSNTNTCDYDTLGSPWKQSRAMPVYSTTPHPKSWASPKPVSPNHSLDTQLSPTTFKPCVSNHDSPFSTSDVGLSPVSGEGSMNTFGWPRESNRLEDKVCVPRPLFNPDSPSDPLDVDDAFMPPPPELEAASCRTAKTIAIATNAPDFSRQAITPSQSSVYSQDSEPNYEDVDEELLEAYGMKITDTGFQGTLAHDDMEASSGPTPGRAKSGKTPRPKKSAPAPGDGNKWMGGPGGPMKFGSKPDGYVEAIGRLARWSYSENGTGSQNANERQVGDIHFSPAIQYDDEIFISWVCMMGPAGDQRWVRFKAGQPHPLHDGYVLRPANLPRLVPRWLKETSYKVTQLTSS